MKKWIILFTCIFFLFIFFSFKAPKEKIDPPQLFFCMQDDCAFHLLKSINHATKTIHCAFYSLELQSIIHALENSPSEIKLVFDFSEKLYMKNARKNLGYQLMHNKFCIIDSEIVITGSFNPTFLGNNFNNNHLFIIHSKYLAKNYEQEFKELWKGQFGKGKKVKTPIVKLNGNKYQNYFCPEDNCEKQVIKTLQEAKKSIYFMVFTFTSKNIAETLIKKHKEIQIEGILEQRQYSKWSQFDSLYQSGIKVRHDNNPHTMHHKVFIIDEKIVILGSYNPTKAGNEKNDENILIIHDETIAQQFLQEFKRIQ